MSELEGQGLTRREMLRKGVITGGAALAWAAPVVTTVGINRAMAASTSPTTTTTTTTTPGDCDISYIAINWTCDGGETVLYNKKDAAGWGTCPDAGMVFNQCDQKIDVSNCADPTADGIDVNLNDGTITNTGDCEILAVGVFAANECVVHNGPTFGNLCP